MARPTIRPGLGSGSDSQYSQGFCGSHQEDQYRSVAEDISNYLYPQTSPASTRMAFGCHFRGLKEQLPSREHDKGILEGCRSRRIFAKRSCRFMDTPDQIKT